MDKKRICIDVQMFPLKLRELIGINNVYDSSCHSTSTVYYVDNGYYIKVDEKYSLKKEANLNRLMYKCGMGVEVINYTSEDKDYLITKEAVGKDLTNCLSNPEQVCYILATALRKLHSKPIEGFPISSRYQRYVELLELNFEDCYYDESVLMNRYMIHSKEEALLIVKENYKSIVADTLIHGDACLPNIIESNNEFSSFIDFSMSGIGSKYIDLYWAIWSLQYNFKTDQYIDLFLDVYGRENLNEKLLRVIAAFELLG